MTLRYLLDTNIVSAPFWKEPPPGLIASLAQTAAESALPVVVSRELRYG